MPTNVVILQRNIKRGNVREFDDSYNRGYTDIWASEVDADFDTLYAAWNDQIMSTTETVVSPSPPQNPRVGDLWWRNTDGNMFIFYDDGNSQQFVPVSSTADYVGSGLPTGPAGGSLAGTYPNPVIAPGAVTDANIFQVSWSKITGAPTSMPPSGPAGGALTGTYPNPTNVLWSKVSGAPAAFPPTGPAGGALTGTYPNPGVAYNSITGLPAIPTTLPPTGPAGGSLAGTYPNPSFAVGAAVRTIVAPNFITSVPLGLNAEMFLLEAAWNSAGGRWFCLAGAQGHLGISATPPSSQINVQLRLDGTSGVVDGNQIGFGYAGSTAASSAVAIVPFSVTVASPGQVLAAGVHRVKMTAWVSGAAWGQSAADSGYIIVGEMS